LVIRDLLILRHSSAFPSCSRSRWVAGDDDISIARCEELVGVLACFYIVNAVRSSVAVVFFGLFWIVFGLVVLVTEVSVLIFSIGDRELRLLSERPG
jgi:hypothetical protein